MQVNPQTGNNGERLLRLPDVEARTGLKKSAIYAGIKSGTFPVPVKLGPRAAAWMEACEEPPIMYATAAAPIEAATPTSF